jgi:hypothetical protein
MRTTSAIRFICQKNCIQILNYLDDLAGCEEEHYCNFAFDFLGKLLQDCGIEELVDKACPPSTRMIFIGLLFDAQKLKIAIDENGLTEIRLLVECWMHKMKPFFVLHSSRSEDRFVVVEYIFAIV